MKNDLPSIISSGIAEFDIMMTKMNPDGNQKMRWLEPSIKAFLKSFATNVHNAALEESFDYFENLIGALGSKLVLSGRVSLEDLDIIKQESRAKLSALRTQDV